MSDPNYEHAFDPNRRGLCKRIIKWRMCHKKEDAIEHIRYELRKRAKECESMLDAEE